MPKPREYSGNEKAVALAYLEALRGDFAAAAKKARVDVDMLRFWASGGDETNLDFAALARDGRPFPPPALMDRAPDLFVPTPEVARWVEEQFLAEDGAFHNPDHAHLCFAQIGFLWTNIQNVKQGRIIAGTAELVKPNGGVWPAARTYYFLQTMFGFVPDFLITLDAPLLADFDHYRFGAVVDHELYHCGQKKDSFGCPKWDKQTGRPCWELRIHDAEEFVGVVSRWGLKAAAGGVAELVEAAGRRPSITDLEIEIGCGTCAH